jgi:hypothetical protein
MVFQEFWLQLELLPWVQHLAATIWFPVINSLHVLSVCLMLGMLLIADLRLLGNAMLEGPVGPALRALLPWTVMAFAVATVSGVLLFMTRAATHVMNPAFQWKMGLLALAGVNVWVFHRRLYPRVVAAGGERRMPAVVRASAALSLILWIGVTLSGRWIGHVFG